MDDLLALIPEGFLSSALSSVSPAVVAGLGLGFAFALLGLLISVPIRTVTKGTS